MPDGGDEILISGWPWEGGETDGGIEPGVSPDLPVGSYPWSVSPWGLLDGSGGEWEWVEDWAGVLPEVRYVLGSRRWTIVYDWDDQIDTYHSYTPDKGLNTFRVASLVPSPSPVALIVLGMGLSCRRRRTWTASERGVISPLCWPDAVCRRQDGEDLLADDGLSAVVSCWLVYRWCDACRYFGVAT